MTMWSRFWSVPDVGILDRIQPQIEAWVDNSHLYDVALGDLGVPIAGLPLGRSAAMRVPAVSRARNLTCGTIAGLPLVVLKEGEPAPVQPYWCYGTDGQLGDLSDAQLRKWQLTPQTPWHRMLWTIDDIYFHGESLWLATSRSEKDGRPLRAVRVPFDQWSVEEGSIIDVDAEPFPDDDIIYIPGPNEGILTYGAETIRSAYDLERTAADVARRPFRLELHQTSDAQLTADERRALIAETRRALADNEGILFTNAAIETKDHALDSGDLLLGGRNQSALDIARHSSMPAAMIDATSAGASLEYSTLAGRNQQWLDYGLSLYTDAVAARLGMDDIVPAGLRTDFDVADWTATDAASTGYPTKD